MNITSNKNYWPSKKICTRNRLLTSLLGISLLTFAGPSFALHIVPVFTSGPCPVKTPTDDVCPGGASQCPAFHDASLVPPGYTSVTYCQNVMGVIGFGFDPTAGQQFVTRPLNAAEQAAWLVTARRIESYVKDDITVTIETYKNASISPTSSIGSSGLVALATEFFTPVCMSDPQLPPYSNTAPTIQYNPPPHGTYDTNGLTDTTLGTYSYVGLPQTYDTMVKALQAKNAKNIHKFALTPSIPSQKDINVEWSSTINYTKADSNIDQYQVNGGFWLNSYYNLAGGPTIVGTNGGILPYPPGPEKGVKPFTICASPANMKALALANPNLMKQFNNANFSFQEINNPAHNPWVTVKGTDGAMTMADFADSVSDPSLVPFHVHLADPKYFSWILDPTDPAIINQQLPIAFYTHRNFAAAKSWGACDDPSLCAWPKGFNWGIDFVATVEHEIHHLLGTMSSEYYKQALEGNGMAATYNNALFVMDLFILDDNAVAKQSGDPFVNPNGQVIMRTTADWSKAPRSMNSNYPILNGSGSTNVYYNANGTNLVSAHPPTPWIQFGLHDHLFTYLDNSGKFKYFSLQNYSSFNPDGDTQLVNYKKIQGFNGSQDTAVGFNYVYIDPLLIGQDQLNKLDPGVQANSIRGTANFPAEREFVVLSALGYDVDAAASNTSQYAIPSRAPTADWYAACFDANGVFQKNGVNGHSNCVFSILPEDLAKIK